MIRYVSLGRRWAFLLLGVCVLLAWDIYEHFSSPAYRYYRELSALLTKRQSDFETRVKEEFVPAIISSATNFAARAGSASSPFASTNSPVDSVQSRHLTLPRSSYFVCAGRGGFRFGGYDFFVGDDIFGECILSIRPTCCITASGRILLFQPDVRSPDLTLNSSLSSTKGVFNDAGVYR